MLTRLHHLQLLLTALPGLAAQSHHRSLLRDMLAFSRQLPATLNAPLPEAMQQLTPAGTAETTIAEANVRQLADVAALLDRRSPLGLCLRRSLIRYHFLRRAGIPLSVYFGAKFTSNAGRSMPHVTGHAWVVHNGSPYHEVDENWRDFAVMLRWPGEEEAVAG